MIFTYAIRHPTLIRVYHTRYPITITKPGTDTEPDINIHSVYSGKDMMSLYLSIQVGRTCKKLYRCRVDDALVDIDSW